MYRSKRKNKECESNRAAMMGMTGIKRRIIIYSYIVYVMHETFELNPRIGLNFFESILSLLEYLFSCHMELEIWRHQLGELFFIRDCFRLYGTNVMFIVILHLHWIYGGRHIDWYLHAIDCRHLFGAWPTSIYAWSRVRGVTRETKKKKKTIITEMWDVSDSPTLEIPLTKHTSPWSFSCELMITYKTAILFFSVLFLFLFLHSFKWCVAPSTTSTLSCL